MNSTLVAETLVEVQEGFQGIHRLGLFLNSILLLIVILELVRRGHLKERYALLWLAVSGCGLLLGLFPGIIVGLSALLHFQYLTFVFVLSFSFLLCIVLAFTVIISRLSERNRILAQELALLSQRLSQLEGQEDAEKG